MRKPLFHFSVIAAGLVVVAAPLLAQVRTVDPNETIDSDLHKTATYPAARQQPAQPTSVPRYPDEPVPAETNPQVSGTDYAPPGGSQSGNGPRPDNGAPLAPGDTRDQAEAAAGRGDTFQREEILRAAEGTFGRGAAGLSGILERTLKEQGQPNAYIAGSEAAGAFVVGLRYGKGTMFHKVEGEQPIYWTGPSVGFDLGGDAAKVFVLVYNLYDTEDIYKRFPAAEGRLYFVGGFAATYLRRGNVVLIPIRLGLGWRQGVNLGYMKFSHKNRWFPL